MKLTSFHSDFPVFSVLFILKLFCLSAPVVSGIDPNGTGRFGTWYCFFGTVVHFTCHCAHYWQFPLKRFHRQGDI